MDDSVLSADELDRIEQRARSVQQSSGSAAASLAADVLLLLMERRRLVQQIADSGTEPRWLQT